VLSAIVILSATAAQDLGADPGNSRQRLRFNAELRGRLEGFTALGFETGNDDGYYLQRIRLGVLWETAPWLRLAAGVQDARAPGRRTPVPASARNPLDIFETYAEIGRPGQGWNLRAGRQRLSFGAQRLVGPSEWSNVARLFDACRISYEQGKARLDGFVSALVQSDPNRFDGPRREIQLHGFYASVETHPRRRVEPYLLWKRMRRDNDRQEIWTGGVRAAGPLPHRLDYELEAAVQAGRLAAMPVRSWASSSTLGRRLGAAESSPRLFVEYSQAAGDKDPDDGVRTTFDQLFPANHIRYGIADRIGWRNMRATRIGLELQPAAAWTLVLEYHSFWLVSRRDFLYGADGAALLGNPSASSSHVHQELDLHSDVRLTDSWNLSFGYARVFPGRFLKESSPGRPVNFAFLMWRLRL
jgi:hypothetical protein